MIWIMLDKYDTSPINKLILNWVRNHIQKQNLNYKLIFCRPYIFESELPKINEKDYILWNPIIASKNLAIVSQYKNSIVVLEKQTLLNEKISVWNPINENQAVNYGFWIMYLNEEDKVSRDWKLVVQADNYLMSQKQLLQTLTSDVENFKQEKIERPDVFDDINNFTKQINFD